MTRGTQRRPWNCFTVVGRSRIAPSSVGLVVDLVVEAPFVFEQQRLDHAERRRGSIYVFEWTFTVEVPSDAIADANRDVLHINCGQRVSIPGAVPNFEPTIPRVERCGLPRRGISISRCRGRRSRGSLGCRLARQRTWRCARRCPGQRHHHQTSGCHPIAEEPYLRSSRQESRYRVAHRQSFLSSSNRPHLALRRGVHHNRWGVRAVTCRAPDAGFTSNRDVGSDVGAAFTRDGFARNGRGGIERAQRCERRKH